MDPKLLERTDNELKRMECDGWLLYSFQGSNDIAISISGLTEMSRPWFILIRDNKVQLLCQAIDEGAASRFPDRSVYIDQASLREKLGKLISGCQIIAMEYSALGAIPYVSKIDAGTFELVQSACPGLRIVSSAQLIQQALTVWDGSGIESHRRALMHLHEIVDLAWEQIKADIKERGASDEYAIQQLIMQAFVDRGLETNHPPIVAVGAHGADPHYAPEQSHTSPIGPGEVVMIDLWAREKEYSSIYADITWMGYTDTSVPPDIQAIWQTVIAGRDAGLKFLEERLAEGKTVQGHEVDRIIRQQISNAGFEQFFIHRSGHSITHELHAPGVNIDSFELIDTREIIPGCGFSIEPGIYIPGRYGFRSEIDVYIGDDRKARVYGPIQKELLRL